MTLLEKIRDLEKLLTNNSQQLVVQTERKNAMAKRRQSAEARRKSILAHSVPTHSMTLPKVPTLPKVAFPKVPTHSMTLPTVPTHSVPTHSMTVPNSSRTYYELKCQNQKHIWKPTRCVCDFLKGILLCTSKKCRHARTIMDDTILTKTGGGDIIKDTTTLLHKAKVQEKAKALSILSSGC